LPFVELFQSLCVNLLDSLSDPLMNFFSPLCEQARVSGGAVIEKARNLSRDLNSAIIEDLKLSGALNWLIHEFVRIH
jgi:hypothetical protein